MVAYSFKRRFVDPIRAGLRIPSALDNQPVIVEGNKFRFNSMSCFPKRQTIRADRKRHARPGEELQLYCGMRTKGCFLIGRARCRDVLRIIITFSDGSRSCIATDKGAYQGAGLDEFARRDGFNNWADMIEFWHREHRDDFEAGTFIGILIRWEPLA